MGNSSKRETFNVACRHDIDLIDLKGAVSLLTPLSCKVMGSTARYSFEGWGKRNERRNYHAGVLCLSFDFISPPSTPVSFSPSINIIVHSDCISAPYLGANSRQHVRPNPPHQVSRTSESTRLYYTVIGWGVEFWIVASRNSGLVLS